MRALRPLFILLVVAGAAGIAYAISIPVRSAIAAEPAGTFGATDILVPMLAGMLLLGAGIAGLLGGFLGGTVDRDDVGPDARAARATLVEVRSGGASERYSRRTLVHLTATLDDGRTVTTKQWISGLGAAGLHPGAALTALVSATHPDRVWFDV